MEIDFAFLADAAEVVNGKFYVMGGGFDTLYANEAPFVYHRPFSYVVRLLFNPAELDRKHHVEIHINDEDGKKIASIEGDLEIKRGPHLPKGWRQGFLSVWNIANLRFEKFGDYVFDVVVNGSSLNRALPFRVTKPLTQNG